MRRPALFKSWVLISSWLVHWVFWSIVVWVAFLLNDIAGWIVAVPVALWFLTLIYLAARYPFVRIELTKDQARMVGSSDRRRSNETPSVS